MPVATRSIVVNVPVADFKSVIDDFDKYPQFLPEVKKISVSNRTEKGCDVSYEIDVIKTLRYTLHMDFQPDGVRWSFVKGDMFKKNDGTWRLEPDGDARTKATYTLEIAFGGFIPVPQAITDKLTAQSLPGLLENFKKRAEKLFPPKSA